MWEATDRCSRRGTPYLLLADSPSFPALPLRIHLRTHVCVQEAGREHDKGMHQVRAKLQRTEAELRTAKQSAIHAAGQVQELEALNAKKDLQLDAAVQQVGAAAAAAAIACGWLLCDTGVRFLSCAWCVLASAHSACAAAASCHRPCQVCCPLVL